MIARGRWPTILLGSLLVAVAACSLSTSQLESGECPTTGKTSFDEYFEAVATLRDEVEELDPDLFPIREPLTEELNLDEDISLFDLVAKVRERAIKFRDYGVMLNLRLTPRAELLKVAGQLEMDPEDEAVLTAVETSATRAMSAFGEYAELLEEAAKLQRERAELAERLDSVSADDEAHDLIKTEIVAAGRVLAEAQRKLLRDCRTLALYAVELARAVDTGAMEHLVGECPEVVEPKPCKPPKKPAWKPGPGPAPRPPDQDFEL